LHGGEDYALLATAPEGQAIEGFARIGVCEPRGCHEPIIVLIDKNGARSSVAPRGFDHFSP